MMVTFVAQCEKKAPSQAHILRHCISIMRNRWPIKRLEIKSLTRLFNHIKIGGTVTPRDGNNHPK